MSEISGVQLNRLLVLATRVERKDNSAQHVVREMIESEFARLSRQGIFSFAGSDKDRP
jgi:LysR family nitrogen assimilation transcriptional regulator